MKIAIINAPPFGFSEPQYDTPDYTRLSLACLGGYLRDVGKYEDILLIDAKFERIGYKEIRRRLEEFEPDIVGHTAFTNEIVQCGHVAMLVNDIAEKTGRKIINVVGGVHVAAMPEETVKEFPQFHYAVIGEGEITFLNLVQYFDPSHELDDLTSINGLAYQDHKIGVIVKTKPRMPIMDQTTLPMPAWDLLPLSPVYLVMTSRGCPFSCNFCMNPNGKVVRKRGVDQFLEELRWVLTERGGRHVNICDEILTVDKERTHEILDGMLEMGFGPTYTFHAQTHVNCIDEPLLKKISKCGVVTLGFGIETADPETLKNMGKGTSLKKIEEATKLARKCKVNLASYFILGQPNETLASAWRSVMFAVKINPSLPVFGIMVPYPGTKVWEWAQKGEMGYKIQSYDWNDYNKQLGNALELTTISRRQIELLQLLGYSLVFFLNFRWVELARFIWKFRKEGVTVVKKLTGVKMSEKATHLQKLHLEFDEIERLYTKG